MPFFSLARRAWDGIREGHRKERNQRRADTDDAFWGWTMHASPRVVGWQNDSSSDQEFARSFRKNAAAAADATWHCHWGYSNFMKLRKARSRLYRGRVLQVNSNFAAFSRFLSFAQFSNALASETQKHFSFFVDIFIFCRQMNLEVRTFSNRFNEHLSDFTKFRESWPFL